MRKLAVVLLVILLLMLIMPMAVAMSALGTCPTGHVFSCPASIGPCFTFLLAAFLFLLASMGRAIEYVSRLRLPLLVSSRDKPPRLV